MATYTSKSLYNPEMINTWKAYNSFEEGLYNTNMRRLNLRKDAQYFLDYQERLVKEENKYNRLNKNLVRLPYYKLKNGNNLFDLDPQEYFHISEILELSFNDIDDKLVFDHLSYLPSLILLNIQYSKISFLDKIPHYDQKFFFNLQVLELSYNNLTNQCFLLIKNIPELRFLNLTGNRITSDIPDLSSLEKLEELNLSYNEIKTTFLQQEEIIEDKDESNLKDKGVSIIEGNSNTNDTTMIKNIDSTLRNNSLETSNMKDFKEAKTSEEKIEKTERANFEEWQKKYLTDLQPFFHKLSMLKNLKILDLANNKISVFDINPYYIKENNYFPCLKKLDLSCNLITHNIGILLVLNVDSLEYLNITGNNFSKKKKIFDSIIDQLKSNHIKLIDTEYKKETKVDRINQIVNAEYNVKKGNFYNPKNFGKKVKKQIELISVKNSKNIEIILRKRRRKE